MPFLAVCSRICVSLLRAHWFNLTCLAWSKLRRRYTMYPMQYSHRLIFGNGTKRTLLVIDYTIMVTHHTHTPPPSTSTTPPPPPPRYAQRSALQLPFAGFATTTDIERALHPPDKQGVAARLLPEIQRVAYGEAVVSRGPGLVSAASSPAAGTLVLTLPNASLVGSRMLASLLATPPRARKRRRTPRR